MPSFVGAQPLRFVAKRATCAWSSTAYGLEPYRSAPFAPVAEALSLSSVASSYFSGTSSESSAVSL